MNKYYSAPMLVPNPKNPKELYVQTNTPKNN